jgi:hypothetical protein
MVLAKICGQWVQQVLAARLEAAHAAFIEYWLSFYDRWALR